MIDRALHQALELAHGLGPGEAVERYLHAELLLQVEHDQDELERREVQVVVEVLPRMDG